MDASWQLKKGLSNPRRGLSFTPQCPPVTGWCTAQMCLPAVCLDQQTDPDVETELPFSSSLIKQNNSGPSKTNITKSPRYWNPPHTHTHLIGWHLWEASPINKDPSRQLRTQRIYCQTSWYQTLQDTLFGCKIGFKMPLTHKTNS